MNTTEYKGNRLELKEKLEQEFADLTDNDLKYEESKEEKSSGKQQAKLGKSKKKLRSFLMSSDQ